MILRIGKGPSPQVREFGVGVGPCLGDAAEYNEEEAHGEGHQRRHLSGRLVKQKPPHHFQGYTDERAEFQAPGHLAPLIEHEESKTCDDPDRGCQP